MAVAVPAIYFAVVHVSYRYERVMAFLHPDADPQGHGFQLMQSLIAVGSGGLTGVGLMESQPEAFLSSRGAHGFHLRGFVRGARLHRRRHRFGAFRRLRLARPATPAFRAPDNFGRFLALGITVMVASQALINLGVVLGMMPTKGIPLPFMSYGGSSLFVMLLATGVLLNISQHTGEGVRG